MLRSQSRYYWDALVRHEKERMRIIRKSSKQEALHALTFAGWVLLTLFVLYLLFWGTAVVLSVVPGSKPAGGLALTVEIMILLIKIQGWGRQVWGLLFLAALNALLFAATGYLPSSPSLRISRVEALTLAGLFALSGFLARRYNDSRLNSLDKTALLLFVGSFSFGWMLNSLPVLAIGVAGLGFAWAYNRIQNRRNHDP